MYTIVDTFPEKASGNVGDKLISESLRKLVRHVKGDVEFIRFFREESLDDHVDEINATRAILLAPFSIADFMPLYPDKYRLTTNLDDLEVPLIPLAARYNIYPGDAQSRKDVSFSNETTEFVQYVDSQMPVEAFSCREYHSCKVLEYKGLVENTTMTGDPSWFDPDHIGKPMKQPSNVDHIVVTPPLSPFYTEQAIEILQLVADLFPKAEKTFCFHVRTGFDLTGVEPTQAAPLREDVIEKNKLLNEFATSHGYEIQETDGDLEKIEFYEECDLHVGYECHADAYFMRHRIPSVLVAEDARGVGFNYTLGTGGFRGFKRCQPQTGPIEKDITSEYCTSKYEYNLAPAKNDLVDELRQYLEEETDSDFQRFAGMGQKIDAMFERRMEPFLEQLP